MTLTPARPDAPHAGLLLRQWRTRRHRSQLDVASESGVSARHLSFVETGRARASRALLLHLAAELDVPLRERNTLLLAGGFAPTFPETPLAGAGAVRDAVGHLLAGHEPYPAAALDRWGDVVAANAAVGVLLDGLPAALVEAPNAYRLGLHPDGLRARTREPEQWVRHLGERLTRVARATADPRLLALLAEVRGWPGVAEVLDGPPAGAPQDVLLTVTVEHAAGPLALHTATTTFGSPHDVTVAELAIELFFPADEATRARLTTLAARRGPG